MRHATVAHHLSGRRVLRQEPIGLSKFSNDLFGCVSGPFHVQRPSPILAGPRYSLGVNRFQGDPRTSMRHLNYNERQRTTPENLTEPYPKAIANELRREKLQDDEFSK